MYAAELRGGQGKKLLLKLLLPPGEVLLGSQQLSRDIRVHPTIIKLK
jgi:hypothetical protein